jgi:hypothetical protein
MPVFMKVKVRSKAKEVLAMSGREFVDGVFHPQFRQFAPPHTKANFGETYMTPKEAAFLVESAQNRAYIEAGQEAEYSYPAGFPMPILESLDGSFQPPQTMRSFHVSDSRQIDQAVGFLADQERSRELAKAKLDAEARGDDPSEVELEPMAAAPQGESANARRMRQKGEREATRASPS